MRILPSHGVAQGHQAHGVEGHVDQQGHVQADDCLGLQDHRVRHDQVEGKSLRRSLGGMSPFADDVAKAEKVKHATTVCGNSLNGCLLVFRHDHVLRRTPQGLVASLLVDHHQATRVSRWLLHAAELENKPENEPHF